MTRKSRREIERLLDKLREAAGVGTKDVQVLRQDDSGDLVDSDGEPVEPDPEADLTVVVVREPWGET